MHVRSETELDVIKLAYGTGIRDVVRFLRTLENCSFSEDEMCSEYFATKIVANFSKELLNLESIEKENRNEST